MDISLRLTARTLIYMGIMKNLTKENIYFFTPGEWWSISVSLGQIMIKHKIQDAGKLTYSVFLTPGKDLPPSVSPFSEYGAVLKGMEQNYCWVSSVKNLLLILKAQKINQRNVCNQRSSLQFLWSDDKVPKYMTQVMTVCQSVQNILESKEIRIF